jgi:death-on-curing protein
LRLNGFSFRPDRVEGVRMMEDLASGQIDEVAFAKWLAAGATPL